MTNARKPATAVRVADLAASLAYYVDRLGCTLVSRPADADVATIAHEGYLLLLAGPASADLVPYMQPSHDLARPGSTLFFDGGPASDLDAAHARLIARGVMDAQVVERWWGERVITTRDPDGYQVVLWTPLDAAPAEQLALYAQGPDVLERALAGLCAADLDRRPAPGEWTIREIVHHITDSEATVLARPKFGLAEPGRVFRPNSYRQETWATGLDYAGRDIAPAVTLFRAIRAHITQLMQHLPDAWMRGTVTPEGQTLTAGTMIGMLVSHAYEHIAHIEELRAAGYGARDVE
jgi:catechol 2,3-dioxygenase-like lactoylglutathione lyase family enzyme